MCGRRFISESKAYSTKKLMSSVSGQLVLGFEFSYRSRRLSFIIACDCNCLLREEYTTGRWVGE